jgi:hypothetical protein
MFCTKPPACLLLKLNRPQSAEFDNLEVSIMPVFPIERSIALKGFSVRRKQLPMCPAFCLTDYKVQGSTLSEAVLDLKNDPTRRGWDAHRRYCSIYVQLSRLRSFNGLHLLQRISMEDIEFTPDARLLSEIKRLQSLQEETVASWNQTNF